MANTIIKLTKVDSDEMWVNLDEFIILKMVENKDAGFTAVSYCWRSEEVETINVIEKPEDIVESIKNVQS